MKLPADDAANRAPLREHGLAVANCVPTVPSFLQLAIPGLEGPADRTSAARRSARRSSVSRRTSREVLVPERTARLAVPEEARGTVVTGYAGQPPWRGTPTCSQLGADPPRAARVDAFACSLADALGLLDEAGSTTSGSWPTPSTSLGRTRPEVVAAMRRFTGAARRRRPARGGSRGARAPRRGRGALRRARGGPP